MKDLLVATRSVGKMREIRRILGPLEGWRVLDVDDAGVPVSAEEDDLEPFATFEENARSKATYFHRRTGLPTVADDSGIVVDALDGAPGVHSKRFAPVGWADLDDQDAANNAYLVHRLAAVPLDRRAARYVCVAVFVDAAGDEIVARGEAWGRIVDHPRGHGGFGYDPHMLVPELERTFAELTPEEKDARSHRAGAFGSMAERLLRRDEEARRAGATRSREAGADRRPLE